jgi:hypothetical protein
MSSFYNYPYIFSDLILLIRYITLQKANSLELLEWLVNQPSNEAFYFLFFQKIPTDTSGTLIKKDATHEGRFIDQRSVEQSKRNVSQYFSISSDSNLFIKSDTPDQLKGLIKALIDKIFLVKKGL